ncbi:hypothetical protein [Bradyrhizobium sp. UFLA05-112]
MIEQQRQRDGRQEAGEQRKVAGSPHPFKADERSKGTENPEKRIARVRTSRAKSGQQKSAQDGEDEIDDPVVVTKACRAQRPENIQRHRQIGVGKFGVFQILDEVWIKPLDIGIDGRAVHTNVPPESYARMAVDDKARKHQHCHEHGKACRSCVRQPANGVPDRRHGQLTFRARHCH